MLDVSAIDYFYGAMYYVCMAIYIAEFRAEILHSNHVTEFGVQTDWPNDVELLRFLP